MNTLAERLYSMQLGDVIDTENGVYLKVVNGWIFTTILNKEFHLPMTNEHKPKKKKKPEQGTLALGDSPLEKLIRYWNKKSAIKCNGPTPTLEKAFKNALSKFSKENIVVAIENYDEVLTSNHYFDTKWGLEKFLKQGNCIPDFLNDGEKWINYKESNKNVPNELGELPEHLRLK